MIPENVKEILKKQHYRIVGKHSAVQVCRWTKKSLRDEGVCYKEKFYGIQSHRCCQMSPCVSWCDNKCLHCWRAIENTIGNKLDKNVDSVSEIIDECIKAQRKLLLGFKIDKNSSKKQLSRANQKKWAEAQEPMQFAISLSGEPTIYPYIGELILELKRREKTSFLVTNGLHPEILKKLHEENKLPTQLYVSVNAPNKKLYEEIHRSSMKNAWEKLNESLKLLNDLKCRTVFRMNLVLNLNMGEEMIEQYAELIKKSNPMFTEIKGFMSVGFARERLGYERMPTWDDIKNYSEKIANATGLKILGEHEQSRAIVLGKNKKEMKIINI